MASPTVAPAPNQMSPQVFAGKIRAKFPGAYDHLSDEDLTQRFVSKHPSYAPMVAPGMPKAPNAINQDVSQSVTATHDTAKGFDPLAPAGTAEKAIGQGSSLIDSARAITAGANFAAPVMTAGASLPIQSAVQGGVAALDTAAQGGSGKQVAKSAAIGAAIPAVAEGLTSVAGSAIKAVKNYLQVPQAISQDVVTTLNKVAQTEGLPAVKATTAREGLDELQQGFMNKAKAQYKVVDDAVGGDLKPVQEKIQQLQKSIRVNQTINPELADKQTAQLAEQQLNLKGLVEKARKNGVGNADQLMKEADKAYSQAMATKKVADGVKTASGVSKMGGHPHPGGFSSQVDRLQKTGLLQRALGEEGANDMIQNATEGLQQAKKVAAAKSVAKKVAVRTGEGALIGAGAYEGLKSLRGH